MSEKERRTHARRDAAVPIMLDVELHGFDTDQGRFQARGRTLNMSRGGLLAHMDSRVQPGLRCVAHFPRAQGVLGRTMIFGTIRRVCAVDARYEIALVFDTPLQDLEFTAVSQGVTA